MKVSGTVRPLERTGLTMLEILLSVFILGLVLFPFLTSFSGVGRGLSATSEYSQALFLAQMALENNQARFEENPLVILDGVDTLKKEARPVVDGQNPYFAYIEDDKAPFGRLIEGIDTSIQPSRKALYRLTSAYRLGIEAALKTHAALPAGKAGLAELVAFLDWQGRDQRSRDFDLPTVISKPTVEPGPGEWGAEAMAGMKPLAQVLFFPDKAGQSLDAIAQAAGADVSALADLAMVVLLEVVSESMFAGLQDLVTELKTANPALVLPTATGPGTGGAPSPAAASANPAALAEAYIKLGKIYERIAAQGLRLCLLAEPALKRLNVGNLKDRLGGETTVAPGRFLPYLWRLGFLPKATIETGVMALRSFASAAEGSRGAALKERRRLSLHYRLLETAGLLSLARADVQSFVSEMLDEIEVQQLGKNPYAVEYVNRFRGLVSDPARFRAVFSVVAEHMDRVLSVGNLIDPILKDFVVKQTLTGIVIVTPEAFPPGMVTAALGP